MPTYDYVCDACEHAFELFQGIMAPVQKKCPKCGKLKLRRLFGTGGAIMFKGSGFYKTDYRSDSYQKAAKSDASLGEPSKSSDSKEKKGTSEGTSSGSTEGTSKKASDADSSRKKRSKKE